MGDTKIDVDDKSASDPPPDSQKPNTKSDVQDTEKAGKSSTIEDKMSKSNSENDGAEEKMLSKPGEGSKIAIAESEYSLNADKTNGEAKLEIGDVKPAFVGMGKEELMKFANDPFWIRLRWIVFIAFWLIWLAMLVGAIVIILTAPKCYPPAPKTWWENGPLAKVDFSDFDLIDSLKAKKVKGLVVKNPDDAYKAVNESNDVLAFLKSAKEKNMNVIVSLEPITSDQFFYKSENKLEGHDDYYIWSDSKGRSSEKNQPIPPNNWLDSAGESAWKFSDKRQQFYYSPYKKPTLNFRNKNVVDKFSSVIQDWLEVGVNGFHLIGVPHMLVEKNLRDESIGNKPGYTHDQYNFYSHVHTVNVDGIAEVLKEWRDASKNKTNTDVVFMLDEDLLTLDAYKLNETLLIDLPKHSSVFETKDRVSTAQDIYDGVKAARTILGDSWPIWNYEETTLPQSVMNILTMLLPGSIYVNERTEIEERLHEIRETPAFTFGKFEHHLLENKTIYAYQRAKTGDPGFLVAVNPSDEQVNVDLTEIKNLSKEVTVELLSKNYTVPNIVYESRHKIPANDFRMPPKSAAILTYVTTTE